MDNPKLLLKRYKINFDLEEFDEVIKQELIKDESLDNEVIDEMQQEDGITLEQDLNRLRNEIGSLENYINEINVFDSLSTKDQHAKLIQKGLDLLTNTTITDIKVKYTFLTLRESIQFLKRFPNVKFQNVMEYKIIELLTDSRKHLNKKHITLLHKYQCALKDEINESKNISILR